jgi:hypothetical protein
VSAAPTVDTANVMFVRMHSRRMTNALVKENAKLSARDDAALLCYNFVRIHQTLKMTPEVAASVLSWEHIVP